MNYKGITYQAIKHRKFTLFMIAVTLFAGFYSYGILPRQENPDISAAVAQIVVLYPGASPTEVEDYVTEPIEDRLRSITGYDLSESVSRSGMANIMMTLDDGIDPEAAWDELDDVMREVELILPSGVAKIIVDTDIAKTPGMVIGLSGVGYDDAVLEDYADGLKDALSTVDGVTKFEVFGERENRIEVALNNKKLNALGLTASEVMQRIQAENYAIPTGKLEGKDSKIEITVDNRFTQKKDIESLLLASFPDGRRISVKDVGKVTEAEDPDAPKFEKDDKPAIFLVGYFEDSLNVVTVGDQVKVKLEQLKQNLPKDLEVANMVYQPDDVEASINNFMSNLIQAIVLVIAVVFIGMGFRNALVVSTAIPFSVAVTMVIMYLNGVKLENLSISGLIIALGMLVDNAIVVSDAIQHYIDLGEEKISAAVKGTKEVAFSMLTSTLTTVFAFMPLLLLNSVLGKFVYGVPFVVTVSLIASFVSAIIVTPVIAVLTFKPTKEQQLIKVGKGKTFFMKLLNWTLDHRKSVYAIALILVIVGFTTASSMSASLLPKADKNMIQIDLSSEFASDLNKTEALKNEALKVLKDIPEIQSIYTSVGSNLPKFFMSVKYRPEAPDIAQVLVQFDLESSKRFKDKNELLSYVQQSLKAELVGGSATVSLLDLGSISRPVEVRMMSGDLDRLDQVSSELRTVLQNTAGTINVEDSFSSKEYQFKVDIDELKANFYGISKLQIQTELSAVMMGAAISDLRTNGRDLPILMTSDIDSKEKLEQLSIRSAVTGKMVALKEFGTIQLMGQFPTINHYSGQRSVTLTADMLPGHSPKEAEAALKAHIQRGDYSDIQFDFEGLTAKVQESNADLGQLAIFSLFMIIAVLILQFNSFSQPLVILTTIPIGAAAALLGLFLSRQELSFIAMLSLVSLMGIVVNNAIVLIDAINSMVADGMTVREACKASVERRYRPIMLSTVTTVIGLIPLLISGGDLFRPLAIALMSGLSVSTFITMIMVPTLYCTSRDFGDRWKAFRKRRNAYIS